LVARRLVPIVTIIAGATVLALLGGGWIDRDRDARLADEERALREEAAELRLAWEGMLHSCAAALRDMDSESARNTGSRVAYLDLEGRVFPSEPPPPVDPGTRLRLEGARETGDRLVAAGDPLRAVDAYTLPLARIAGPGLRAPLLLAAARAALGTSELAPWGRATLLRLRDRPLSDALHPERGPVDLAAALALPPEDTRPVTAADLHARLGSEPLAGIAALAARFRARPGWVDDPRFDEALAGLRREETAILRRAEELRRGRAALEEWLLLLPLAGGDDRAAEIGILDVSTLLHRPLGLYELVEPGPILVGGSVPAPVEEGLDRVRETLRLEGAPLGTLVLRDREAPERRESIERRASILRMVLWATLAIVSGALFATWSALDRQRRLAELKIRLLANVSHELKTPVTSIRMLGELLQSPVLPRERVAEFGELITRESKRLGRRIEEILETAWSRASRAPLPRTEVALGAAVEEVAGRFRARAEAAGGEVRVVAAGEPTAVETNRDALERIVENLLDNALKYGGRRSPDGDSLRAPRVTVTVAGEPGLARVAVEDDGPGVPAGEGERIFEPFYRAAFDDFAVPGSGLGLAISRSFAERLGGALACEPRPGGGSRFVLTLPCRAGPGEEDAGGAA